MGAWAGLSYGFVYFGVAFCSCDFFEEFQVFFFCGSFNSYAAIGTYVDSVFSFGDTIHVTCGQKDMDENSIRKYLMAKGQQNVSVDEISASIEDVFMELMQKVDN